MTVCITGAASGIGYAISNGFLDDGAKVVAVDINNDGLEALKEKGAITRIVDVTDYAQVKSMIKTAVDETGRLDALFNNAGIGRAKYIHKFEDDEYEQVIRVNVFGPVYGMRAAIPVMRTQNFGRIINLLSRAAEAGNDASSPYNSSKAALWSVTRTAAVENLDFDILINGMIPGPTKSGLNPIGQDPEVVYPSAKWMATLPTGGPTGKVFWNQKEYDMFNKENITFRFTKFNRNLGRYTPLNLDKR
jgi:NAD(P)-dependent dehydrogenase (short-subunit alcohol dehydrogenase family)